MRAKLVKENINNLFKPKSEEDIIKKLNKLTQEEKDKKLFKSCIYGQLDIVKMLIEAGANINVKDNGGDTALMRASVHGNEDIIKLLIEAGADVNAKDNDGSTSLMWALSFGHIKVVDLLKKYGAK